MGMKRGTGKDQPPEDRIKDLILCPGWEDVVAKVELISKNTQTKLNHSTKENIDYNKGQFDMISLIRKLFVEKPLEIVRMKEIK